VSLLWGIVKGFICLVGFVLYHLNQVRPAALNCLVELEVALLLGTQTCDCLIKTGLLLQAFAVANNHCDGVLPFLIVSEQCLNIVFGSVELHGHFFFLTNFKPKMHGASGSGVVATIFTSIPSLYYIVHLLPAAGCPDDGRGALFSCTGLLSSFCCECTLLHPLSF